MATWHDKTFTFDLSLLGSDFLSPPPASNRFTLTPSRDTDNRIYLYTITPEAPGAVPPFWAGCKLLPQGGTRLTKHFRRNAGLIPGTPEHLAEISQRVTAAQSKVTAHPFRFERLVGTLPKNGKDNPVAFYQIERGYPGAQKTLLVVVINLIGASPNGTVAGNA
jgi:hypothetical protein